MEPEPLRRPFPFGRRSLVLVLLLGAGVFSWASLGVHFQDLVGADPLRPEIKNNELTIDENENQIEDDKMEEDIQVTCKKAEGTKCPVCWKISKTNCKKHGHLTN